MNTKQSFDLVFQRCLSFLHPPLPYIIPSAIFPYLPQFPVPLNMAPPLIPANSYNNRIINSLRDVMSDFVAARRSSSKGTYICCDLWYYAFFIRTSRLILAQNLRAPSKHAQAECKPIQKNSELVLLEWFFNVIEV